MTPTRTGRRAASAAIAAALIATLTLTGAVAAKDHPNKPEKAHPVKSGQTQGGGGGGGAKPAALEKPASLKVKGNASHPGSVFRVNAVLKSARDARPETMEAVVHFATGDVTVELTRQGGGAAYHAWVPVPEDEPEGVVLIDATAQVDGETVEATGAGKILDRGEGADEEPEALEQPEASPQTCEPEGSPEPEASPEASPAASGELEPSPTESAAPSPTESAEASPTESAAPSPTESAEASPSDAGESPEPTASPDAEETADDECPDGEGGTAQLTAAVLARIIAYIESLMA